MLYRLLMCIIFSTKAYCQVDSTKPVKGASTGRQNIFLNEFSESISATTYFEKANSGFYEISFTQKGDTLFIYRLDSSMLLKKIGKPIYFEKLKNLEGNSVEYPENKVTIINFWSTTCRPCIEEIDSLNLIVKDYPNLYFIGITPDSVSTVKRFLEKRKFEYKIAFLDQRNIDSLYGVQMYPTHFFVDRQRLLKQIFIGKKQGLSMELSKFLLTQKTDY